MSTSEVVDRLRSAPIFLGVDDHTLRRLADEVSIVSLTPGAILFEEGDEGRQAFVVLTGEIEVTVLAPPHRLSVATCGPGDVLGEMSLLRGRRRNATAIALTDASLAVIEGPLLEDLGSRTSAGRDLIRTVLHRLEETEARVEQARRMAQLGTLTSGVAHELNNPASAVRRTAASLDAAVTRILLAATTFLDDITADAVAEAAASPPVVPIGLGAAERLDRTEALRRRLEASSVADHGRLSEELASLGADESSVSALLETPPEVRSEVVELVAAVWAAGRMAGEVERAAARITQVTDTLASYSRLGRAPRSPVDVTEGIDDSLALLADRLGGIAVRKEYAADVPAIDAVAAELNQVWTNLLVNAADATGPGGVVTVRVHLDGGDVVVDVIDDGPGIDDAVLPRIFDDFYTTKPPGSGTGLGLAISRRIVVGGHGGRLSVDTEPGRTVFRTRLPTSARKTGGS